MPKIGMEPLRRKALIDATIAEIGEAGTLSVTVGRIAKRAGMSSGLAHHYFGTKEEIFLAAMRHILRLYGQEIRRALARAEGPRGRVQAIVEASFHPSNFSQEAVGAWLNFYVYAQTAPEAHRLLQVYVKRLRSNLIHGLRPLVPEPQAKDLAEGVAALIDGFYIRQALHRDGPRQAEVLALVSDYIDRNLGTAP